MLKLRSSVIVFLFYFSIGICQGQHIERGQSNYSDFELFFQKGFNPIELISNNFRISKVVTNVDIELNEYKISTKLILMQIGQINSDSIRIILPLLYDAYRENGRDEFDNRRSSSEGHSWYKFKVNGDTVLCKYDNVPNMINKDIQVENCYADFFIENSDIVEVEIKYFVEYFYSVVDYLSGLGEYEERLSQAGFIPKTNYSIDTFELYLNNNIPNEIPVYLDSSKIGKKKVVKEYNTTLKENTISEIRFNPDNYLVSKDFLKCTLDKDQIKLSDNKWEVLFDKNPKSSIEIKTNDVIEFHNINNEKIYEMFILLDSATLSNREDSILNIPVSITTQLYDSKTDSIYSETKIENVKFYGNEYGSKAFAHTIGYATPYTVGNDPYGISDFFNNDTQEPYSFKEPKILKLSFSINETLGYPVKIAEIFLLKVEE